MMMCSHGVRTVPFAEGLRLGADQKDGVLYLSLESTNVWRGRLCFDRPRVEHAAAKIDWARINEMPRWFVARPERTYAVAIDGETTIVSGRRLIEGLELSVERGQRRRIRVAVSEAERDQGGT